MPYTYDLDDPIGKMRLLIPDRIEGTALFQDEELAVFLELELDKLLNAVAMALETISTNEALLFKKIEIDGLISDAPATSKVLLQRADGYRKQQALLDEQEAILASQVGKDVGYAALVPRTNTLLY